MASSARANVATKRDLLRVVRGAIARGELPPEAEEEAVERLSAVAKTFALTRRDLLKVTAASAGLSLIAIDAFPRSAEARSILAATPSLSASVLRRDDMLALRFDLYNLVRDNQNNLVRQNAAQAAYVVVTPGYGLAYAPQNVGEEAFYETNWNTGTAPATAPGDVGARLAGPTRLAFKVPATMTSIPFTLGALLNFTQFEPSVVPVATPRDVVPGDKTIRAPGETETAIETPWHMVLSPHANSAWAHARLPVAHQGRTELWHTRLAVRNGQTVDELNTAQRNVRAVWTEGFIYGTSVGMPANPFPYMSLKPLDRWQIVHLSSDFNLLVDPPKYMPRPIDVEHLMLTALGAWQKTRGFFSEPPQTGQLLFSLGEWRHIATMGRDQFVRVVNLGWLLPFGHPAALITITERKIQPLPSSTVRAAYLRQRKFILVRKPIVEYPEEDPQPDEGREFPYKTVELKTTVTPTLDDPASAATSAAWSFETYGEFAFVPVINDKPFQFSIVGTDRDGQASEFTLPLAYVSYAVDTFKPEDIVKARDDYIASQFDAARKWSADLTTTLKTANLDGQKVGMAPSTQSELKKDGQTGGKPGDTAVEIKTLSFNAIEPSAPVAATDARWFPIWTDADVRLNGVEQVKGGTGLAPTVIQPHPEFVTGGFNSSELFAKLKTNVGLTFVDATEPAGDRSGGLVNPDMSIAGLSRKLGPVGNTAGAIGSLPTQFEPADFFKDAKILGGILLKDIIEAVGFDEPEIPKLVTNTVYPNGDTTQPPSEIVVTMNFAPKLKQDLLKIFNPDDPGGSLTIDATFRTPIVPPGPPTYEIVGDLRNCGVTLISGIEPSNLISIHFSQLKFTTKTGSKPNVDIDINEVKFVGVLAFVNTLKDYLKLGSTGPSIDIQPTSVTAGFSIPIPTIGVGVLTIQNIAFGAGVTVPFTGKPARARFNFSEREDQFLVTVMGLGGGGFFAISLGLDGLEILEMGIEVGASVALDLGVASGEVHALAGFYYRLEKGTPDKCEIDGYVRLGGSVNVLGIASVSVEFYLGLKYQSEPDNELWGQASLTVEVEVLCFSKSFSFSVERRIAGGSSASASLMPGVLAVGSNGGHMASLAAKTKPAFNITDLMDQSEWTEYAAAFATS
jgi:hypothetical protein